MVISRRASAKAVIEVHETDAQPVSSATAAGPLSAPYLRGTHDYGLWPTQGRGGKGLRQHAKTKQSQKYAYEDSQTEYMSDIKEDRYSKRSSVHNLFPFLLGLP
jgi:hypothetical protein